MYRKKAYQILTGHILQSIVRFTYKRPICSSCCPITWGAVVAVIISVQSVPITTKVVSLNPVHGEVYSIQHHVIKFVSDLQQVLGFLQVLWFSPPIKLTTMI